VTGLRERKKERQRGELLQAAVELFRERGYDDARVADIVERVDVSEGTFFNYFKTKDALLDELALVQIELFREVLRYELEESTQPVPERIREAMRAGALAIAADRSLQEVIYTRSSLFSSRGVLKQRTFVMYDALADLFRAGQQQGEIRDDRDAMQLAEMLIAIYRLTVTNWLIDWWSEQTELEQRLLAAVDVFLDGCDPR
jgi:AcrR family transcriptional regulator